MPFRPLPPELQEISEGELNEVPSRLEEDLKHIRDWIAQQPHLTARTDDQWLLSFLRGCKFSLHRTKERIDKFYTIKTLLPEFFVNRDPFLPEIQKVLKQGIMITFPNTPNSTDPSISLYRANFARTENMSATTLLKVALMIMEIMFMENDNCSVCGQYALLNLEGTDYKYVAQLTPSFIKKAVLCFQSAYPTRIKGIYVLKVPSFLEVAYKVFKELFNEKIRDRMYLFDDKNLKQLYKTIPISVLPKELGGDGDNCNQVADEWKRKIESYREWFLEDEQYCIDESKRPGKPKTSGEMFGLEGSFRKLDID